MSNPITTAVGKYPALANGPLVKPDGMKGALLKSVRASVLPSVAVCLGVYAVTMYATFFRRKAKIDTYMKNLDPDAMFEEIKEYGAFKSVKASWQE
ncbi:cytochrome c oxidase subunit 6C-like [Ciona intestinalis]